MSLNKESIDNFLEILSSSAPAPGGGAVASLEGAIASSLIHMVASLTINKEKYSSSQEFALKMIEKAKSYQDEFQKLIDEDVSSFNEVSKVFKMPKETEEEKNKRKEAMQKALKIAIMPPLKVMRLVSSISSSLLECTDKLNQNALSDIGVASLTLDSALKGAYLNVLINLGSIKDESFKEKIKIESQELLEETSKVCNKTYKEILARLN